MNGLEVDIRVHRPDFEVAAAFDVAPGSALALVGPNGAGKSTILAAIAGTQEAEGRVGLAGRDLTSLPADRRGIGVVFQDFLLFPHLTVRDNVAFGSRVRGRSRRQARLAADPWLERFELAGLADRRPDDLSGGQRQRVALARALASEPDVLLLDEVLAALDVEVRADVRADLARHVREFGGPAIVVTHDPADVTALADDIVVIERGRVVQRAPSIAALAEHPATPWVAHFAGISRP